VEIKTHVAREIQESITVKAELAREAGEQIAEAGGTIIARMRAGGKLIVFGNGGSAADAQHFVAELVGRYRLERKPFAAFALTTNSSSTTAIANDYGFDQIFSRQLEAIAKPGDVAVAISTSGNSPNVLRALESAKELGLTTIGLTGNAGDRMRSIVDVCVTVPSLSAPRIQEAHILIIHILSGVIEGSFVAAGDAHRLIGATTNHE
jgi:D-sedoheptulose 7-phosphate isomerase